MLFLKTYKCILKDVALTDLTTLFSLNINTKL